MFFKSTDAVTAYMKQNKPPFSMKWMHAEVCLNGEDLVSLMAVEKYPIDDRDIYIVDPLDTSLSLPTTR